jgi:hypothetical protein
MNWYYAQGDQRQGPVSDSELDALIAAGTVNENTLVWKEGMANWAPLKEARSTGPAGEQAPPGWIRCTATGRYFPPEEIVYLDGKPYSAAAKAGVLQGVMQTGSLPTSEVGRNGPAWENRAELGFFPSIMQTVKAVLLEPASSFAYMKREGGLGNPLGYYVLLSWLGFLVAALYNVVFQGIFNPLAHNSQAPISPFAMSATVMGVMVVVLPIFSVIGAFIMAGVFHLSLMLFQGARQPFEATFRTFCYAFGSVAPLQLIPGCGSTIGFIWGVVAMCIGIAKVHEINTGRGVAAVLVPLAVCCIAAILFYAVIIAAAVGAVRAGQH